MKALSPLVSMVLVTAFGFAAMAIVLTVVNPLLDRAKDAGIVNEATQNMQLLDSAIKAVASEPKASKRTIQLKITDGVLRTTPSNDLVFFEYEPRTSTVLDGFAGDVKIESRPIFLEYFNWYGDNDNANETWNAVNGTWSVSSGRFLGRGGIAYKNVGNQSGFELAATIVPSTAPDGQVYVVPGDPRDLVLYLPFDGNVNTSVTTAYDYSAYANNGTLSNTTSATCFTNNACPSWTTDSKFGNATQYDGVGDYISIGNRAEVNFTTNSFTIAFWINSPGAPGRMVQKGNSDATGGKGYGIFFQSGTDLTFSINNGTGLQTIGGAGVTVTANQWDHVAYVVDRTSNIVTGYKNGVSKGTFSISNEPGDISATQGLNIGARSVGPPVNNFNGTLDEIMIFNRSLTAKEILFLYETSIKKITASGEIPSINNTENVTIVLASPGSSYFDNIKVKSGPANIRFVIPYQNIDIVNQTRFGPGDHNIVIRHYGINTTSNMPMIGVEE